MEHKATDNSFEIKSDQEGVKKITGYASVFGNVDSHGDIILPGAFVKSIHDMKNRKIRLFSSHDMDAREMLGTVTMLVEDDTGLYFEAEVSSAPSAQDIAIKAKEGHLDEVSIGFFLKDHDFMQDERTGERIRLIKSLELVEISLVSRASNPQAKVVMVKEDNNIKSNPVENESSELPTKLNTKICEDKMTEEHKNEENVSKESEMLASFEKKFEEKINRFQELLDQPMNKTPFTVEEKSEEPKVEVRSEEQMHNDASALFYDYAKGDLTKKEYKDALEAKALSSVVVEDGAALVPMKLHNEIIQKLDRINKIEAMVTKLNGNGPLDILDYSFDPSWSTHDDGDAISETSISSIFGKSTLDPQDYAALVTLPNKLERRSFQQIQPLLAGDFARAYADLKEDKILLGSGHKEPLGVVTLLDTLAVNTESITAIANLDYTAVVNVTFKLNEEYRMNGAFAMHPDALKQVMLITDGQGLPIWNRPVSAGAPSTLLGYPIFETRALEDGNASGESPCVFGDFSKYVMLEEKAFSVEASRDANFSSNKLTLRMVVSFDGMPVDKNAFSRIEIA
jgi:uncharacterized protein